MSVQPGPTFKRYAANGVATVYTIPFLLLDAADLQITLNGVPVTAGFSLTGIGNPQSTCTFTAAPTGDLLFQQAVPFQRLADFQNNGDFLAITVNSDFDRLWLAVKQLSRDSNRALTVSLLEPEGIPPLPAKAMRALKMLAFDGDGNPITSNLTLAQLEQQPALALTSAAQAAASALAASNSKDAAALSATASSNSAVLSQKWAENPEDTPVTPGLFSAHHWANKAAALVATISGLYTRMTAVEGRATTLEARPRALGDGQAWTDVTASRVGSTWYPNGTGRSIVVQIIWAQSGGLSGALYVRNPGGTEFQLDMCQQTSVAGGGAMTGIVPPGWDYRIVMGNTVTKWQELRT